MATFQITGKLLDISDERRITDKFTVRDIVLLVENFYKKEDRSYPIAFQAINAKSIEMDSLNIKDALRLGLNVMVNFEIKGREGKDGKIWNSLNIQSIVTSDTQSKIIQPQQPRFGDVPPAGETINPAFIPKIPVSSKPYEDGLPF